MNIHLVSARLNLKGNIDHLRQIVEAVHEDGHHLVIDWVEPAYNTEVKHGEAHPIDWASVYKESLDAINKADVVIADSTERSFSVGYQVAVAIQLKKPTLVLRQIGSVDSFFASGIDIGIQYKEYDEKNIKSLVAAFIKENDIQTKDMRFNFFIDRPIYNYLRWTSHRTGKTKAEILRELVVREIDRDTKPSV